ncbi:MAG: CPBP family intramembrane metalloprotease [Acidobacteria bacterium]|nr:CPBP family intramembrane metalloprotease [Acidobacteriota bacterium]
MRTERLDGRDLRLVAISLAAIVASAVYIHANYSAAFPQASINLRLSKDEVTARADAFLRTQGLRTEGFRNLTLFDPDDDARLFLEREAGLDEANRLMTERISVWRWRARWFRPPEKEEMLVWLSPDGRLAGFEHVIAETTPGARLSQEQARARAEDFLKSQSAAPHHPVEARSEDRPNRRDHFFTWEQDDLRVKDARYRRSVVVQGDRIGEFREFLYVPEQWKRDFAALRSKNELYSKIAQAFYVPLILAAVGVLIHALRKKQVSWRPLVLIAGLVGALMTISQWNNFPFFLDGMPTSAKYPEAVAMASLLAVGAGVGVFFYVILAAAAGEPLYRALRPAGLALEHLPTRRGFQTRDFFRATVAGYGFAAAHLAFVVAFYLIGRRFGVWSPQDVEYSDLLSTRLPWIYPLTISVLAATSEEFWFRLFAVPLLKRWLRSTWIAVLIPAFVWGFLHANYPQQPGYIRGIEVGAVGVAAGFLMLRFGIVSTLVWHYTVDAVLIGTYLLRAESWYFRLSGVAVGGAVLAPFLLSLFQYYRRGGFAAEEEAVAAETPPAEPEEVPAPAEAKRWPLRWLAIPALTLAVAAAFLAPREFGGFVKLALTRDRAAGIADVEMRSRANRPAEWRRVTEFAPNLKTEEFEYVRRIAGAEAADRTVAERTLTGLWRTRYFKPLQKEEWRVFVGPDARVVRVEHVLDEKAPGARLTPDQARERAAGQLGVSRLRLVEAHEEKRDHRTDHTFVWEDPEFRMGEARARVSAEVLGDEVSTYRRFLKLPDEWVREFERPRLLSYLAPAVIGGLGLPLLVILIRRLSRHRFHWRVYGWLAAAGFVVAAAATLNQWPTLLARYPTSATLDNFLGQLALGRLTWALFVAASLFAGALAVDVYRQLALGHAGVQAGSARRAALVALLVWGAGRVLGWAGQQVPGPRLSLPLASFPGTEGAWPALSILSQSFFVAALWLCAGATGVLAAAGLLKRRGRIVLAVSLAATLALSRAQNVPQALAAFALYLAAAGVLLVIARTCAADLVSFAVALFWLHAAELSLRLLPQPAAFYRWNALAAMAVAAAAGWLLLRYSKNTSGARS